MVLPLFSLTVLSTKLSESKKRFPMSGPLNVCLVFWLSGILICCLPAAQARNILIQGAMLIDGTGKPPITDSRILIEGNTIRQVWSGDAAAPALPPDTQVLDARGKFIIPGLIDSHVHYNGYMGEIFLSYGITTVYDLGNPIYWQIAVKKGLNSGKIRGPRFYFCSGIGGEGEGLEGQEDGVDSNSVNTRTLSSMKTPAGAKQAIAALKGKTDCVKLSENTRAEFFTAIAREAHAAGMNVISHSFNAMDSAKWGIDGVEHMTGVAISAIRSPQGRKAMQGMTIEAGHKNSLLYQWMDPSYFDEMIQFFVQHNVYLNPTLDFEWKGIIDRTPEFEVEDARLLYNPLLPYVPLDERLLSLGQYHWADKRPPSDREQFLKGYRNVQEFLRRFVKAGGKIYSGTDAASANTPGLALHHEMELYTDAGISPMDTLLTSTKWAAEILHLDKTLGTIEPNKLADLVILKANPLDDIRNTKAIDQVMRDGEIVDIAYHADYQIPFPLYGPPTKHLYNPPPELRDIKPATVEQGKEVNLRVLGKSFVPGSVVLFRGSKVRTKWINSAEVSAVLTSEETSEPGNFLIVVQSPKPGGGDSEALGFIVDYRDHQ